MEIVDATGEEIVPYVIHLSKRGIAPKILGVEGGFMMTMKKAEGPRLFQALGSLELPQLQEIYRILGRNIAYMNKLGVMHEDLHTNNVIVENSLPVIIDWDKASLMPIEKNRGDLIKLVEDTAGALDLHGKGEELHVPLKRVIRDSYDAEKSVPLDITHREIQRRAYEEFGVI